jgi:serine phosphatase RsbU (regulator of sigma subunit)
MHEATTENSIGCMEIIGGNRARRQLVHAPALDIWIDSRPLESIAGGGDIHYVSTCGAGYVTRLALADVSGHGSSADRVAVNLRKLMRKYINTLDQTRFAKELNREFAAADDEGRFATAVLLTYFALTNHLLICNAGHGRPLCYRQSQLKWQFLDVDSLPDCQSLRASQARYHLERVANLPLGILDPTDYEQFAVRLDTGDVIVLYTDAVTECENSAGRQLGEAGLLEIVERQSADRSDMLCEQIIEELRLWRSGRTSQDDQTVIVLQRSESKPPPVSIGRTLHTLAKMLGLQRV